MFPLVFTCAGGSGGGAAKTQLEQLEPLDASAFHADDFLTADEITKATHRRNFWETHAGGNGSISHAGGKLNLVSAATGTGATDPVNDRTVYVRTKTASHEVKFTSHPISVTLKDWDNGTNDVPFSRRFHLSIDSQNTGNGNNHWGSADSIAIRLQDQGGNPKMWVGAKTNQPETDVFSTTNILWGGTDGTTINLDPTDIKVLVDGTYIIIELYNSSGLMAQQLRLKHSVEFEDWSNKGGAFVTLECDHPQNSGTQYTATVGRFEVETLLWADFMGTADLNSTTNRIGEYTQVLRAGTIDSSNAGNDEPVITTSVTGGTGVGGFQQSWRHTRQSKHFNHFGGDRALRADIGPGSYSANNGYHMIGLTSGGDFYTARNFLALRFSNTTVDIVKKEGTANSMAATIITGSNNSWGAGKKVKRAYVWFGISQMKWTLWFTDNTTLSYSANTSGNGRIKPSDWDNTPWAGNAELMHNGNSAICYGTYASSGGTAVANYCDWAGLRMERAESIEWCDTVFGPVGDGMYFEENILPASQDWAHRGALKPGAAPFNADTTGTQDATAALRHLNEYASMWQYAQYFPSGTTYRISNQIQYIIPGWFRTSGKKKFLRWEDADDDPDRLGRNVNGNASNARQSPDHEYPQCIIGGNPGNTNTNRPKIIVSSRTFDSADGWTSRQQCLVLWNRETRDGGPLWKEKNNSSMSDTMEDIEIEIEPDNDWAVGLNWKSAQSGGLANVKITATDAYALMEGISGSGGGNYNIELDGGQRGFIADAGYNTYDGGGDSVTNGQPAQSGPMFVASIFRNQTVYTGQYLAQSALHLIGCEVYKPAGGVMFNIVDANGVNFAAATERGQAIFSDTIFDFGDTYQAGTAVIRTGRTVTFENCYVRNAEKLIDFYGVQSIPAAPADVTLGPSSEWWYIPRLTVGIDAQYGVNGAQVQSPIVLGTNRTNMVRQTSRFYGTPQAITAGQVPTDLRTRHLITNLPNIEDSDITWLDSLSLPERHGYAIDTTAKFANAVASNVNNKIGLPRCHLRVQDIADIYQSNQILGIGRSLATLIVTKANPSGTAAKTGDFTGNWAAGTDNPIVRTANGAFSPILRNFRAHASIDHDGVYCVENRSSNATFMNFVVEPRHVGGFSTDWYNASINADDSGVSLTKFTGNSGGRFHNLNQGSDYYQRDVYRGCEMNGVSNVHRFYQLNFEHNKSSAGIEIINSSNISMYGFKTEGNFTIIRLSGTSDNIRIFGIGGNATPWPYNITPNRNYDPDNGGPLDAKADFLKGLQEKSSGITAGEYSAYQDGSNPKTSALVFIEPTVTNFLISQCHLISKAADTNRSTGVFGRSFAPNQFHVINYGNTYNASDGWVSRAGAVDPTSDRPALVLVGNPSVDGT